MTLAFPSSAMAMSSMALGFSIERNGNVIDDIDFSIDGNVVVIDGKTRSKKVAAGFRRDTCDLRGLDQKNRFGSTAAHVGSMKLVCRGGGGSTG